MFKKTILDFNAATPAGRQALRRRYRITLTEQEILKIQNKILQRPPTLTECVLWSIQGSEHSSYKSSRPFLKQFITQAPNVLLGPTEDAGIVEVARDRQGQKYGAVISHESHNHPSQIVPYEGAATGIGGNVRDVSCMGAKVIACLDSLRFGEIKRNKTKWIHQGVVAGIAGYGNPIGVPNIGGDLYYDTSYNDNCLVNVVTIGVLRASEIIHSRAPKNAVGYQLILVGKPTDNSGFGGASFASLEIKEEKKETNKGAVQEPNAFLKRHLLKASYALFKILKQQKMLDKVGLKDLGAGGIACASVEMAEAGGYGAQVILDAVPLGMKNLHPSIILCSETQERYLWIASPKLTPLILKHYNKTYDLPRVAEGAQAVVIGKITKDGQFVVKFQGETEVQARTKDVTRGLLYHRPYKKPQRILKEPQLPEPTSYNKLLLKILAHENIASREPVWENYDKNVQGLSVIEAGEADAGVLQPFKDQEFPKEIQQTGLAVSVDHNPRYGKIDPYWCGANAVVEAIYNVAAVGASPQALTDCLNFGNPEKEEQMGEFVEATRGLAAAARAIHLKEYPSSSIPIIAGNVSFYNESAKQAIAPSPIVACLGKIPAVSKAITPHFKKPDSLLLMIGKRRDECGGSIYYAIAGALGKNLPKPRFKIVEKQIWALITVIEQGLILAAHNIADGGIATALAEMSFKNEIGCQVQVPGKLRADKILFSETGGFILEVPVNNLAEVKKIWPAHNLVAYEIGRTVSKKQLQINNLLNLNLPTAKKAWQEGLRRKL